MPPASHAATILHLLAGLDTAGVERALGDPGHPAFTHAAALADSADSADESERGAGLGALFAGLVEPLNDSFRPAGRAAYARLFTHIVWRTCARDPALTRGLASFSIPDEAALYARYARARRGTDPLPTGPVRRILILSRVTIGADVLLTTVVVQRLHQRFPDAELVILGDAKLSGLVGGLPQVRVRPLAYGRRGPLRERLGAWLGLVEAVTAETPDLVVAPDSRLDQLGILPVTADPARYLLWENTLPDDLPAESLAAAVDRALARRLGLAGPRIMPRVAFDGPTENQRQRLAAAFGPAPLAAVKLDHGGNPAKALPRAAEVALLRHLKSAGWRILLDRGFGPAELANSDALLHDAGWTGVDIDDSGKGLGLDVSHLAPGALAGATVIRFHGSIGGWAAALAGCGLAVSYDSVGHHLAAALGVPLVTAFTGHPDQRFATAWSPQGPGKVTVVEIPTEMKEQPEQWERVMKECLNARMLECSNERTTG